MSVVNAGCTPFLPDESVCHKTSFKKAFWLAAEWRIISLFIDFCIACVLYAFTKKAALAFGGLGAASLIRFTANALWLKYRTRQ